MKTVHKCFISLILTYKVSKIQLCSVVRPTKLAQAISSIFSPKTELGAKLAGTNNKNSCGMAEVRIKQFRSVSYN